MTTLTTSPTDLRVPLLDLRAQYNSIRDELDQAIKRVVESQHFILGPEVEGLEQEIADYSQVPFAIGVSSGTDALLVSLMAIDLQPGDEVLTTPYTFFATAGAVARLGGKPVFVDIDPQTFNLAEDNVEEKITQRTRAIIPVHLFGQMTGMHRLSDIAKKHNLFVIEDAAQAIGAEEGGRRAGSLGQLSCFSFFPSKNLGAFGDGGMVTSTDPHLADQVRLLRNHGYRPKYYNKVVGGNFRLDALQAAVLRVKLKYLDQWTTGRQRNASIYSKLFSEAGLTKERHVVLPYEAAGGRHIYNQYVIRAERRDELMKFLKDHGVGTEVYYPVTMHLQECFSELGYKAGAFPEAERAASETLALPIYPELTEEMLAVVVERIKQFYFGAS